MRIEIDLSASQDPSAYPWLDRILNKIEDGWHVWDTSTEDIESMMASSWVSDEGRQGKRVREILKASVQRTAWSAPWGRRLRVTVGPKEMDEVNPEVAALLAEEPLLILVESRTSDGAFVERIAKELDRSLRNLWDRRSGPIRFASVGGKDHMKAEVESRVLGKPHRPRLVAIVDSDRKSPEDEASPTARRLQRKCASLDVPCWVLAKREAENYLPKSLLSEREDAGADHVLRVEAWNRLTEDQKDHYDMKGGFPDVPTESEEILFDSLSSADRVVLASGFGQRVYKCWTLWAVQAKTELTRRGRGDLELGIDLIRGEA